MHSNSKALAPSILFIHCVQNYSFAKVKKTRKREKKDESNIDKTATLTPPFPLAGVCVYVEQASSFLPPFSHFFFSICIFHIHTHTAYAVARTPVQC